MARDSRPDAGVSGRAHGQERAIVLRSSRIPTHGPTAWSAISFIARSWSTHMRAMRSNWLCAAVLGARSDAAPRHVKRDL